MKGSQIFQNSGSHKNILGANWRHEASPIPKTHKY